MQLSADLNHIPAPPLMQYRAGRRLLAGVLTSILLHGLVLLIRFGLPGQGASTPAPHELTVALAPIPPAPAAAPVEAATEPVPPVPAPATGGMRLVAPRPQPAAPPIAPPPRPASHAASAALCRPATKWKSAAG